MSNQVHQPQSATDHAHQRKAKRVASPDSVVSSVKVKRTKSSQSGTLEEPELSDSDETFPKVFQIVEQVYTMHKGRSRSEYYSALLAALWFNALFVFNPNSIVRQSTPDFKSVPPLILFYWRRALAKKIVTVQDEIQDSFADIGQDTQLLIEEYQYLLEHQTVTNLPEDGEARDKALLKKLEGFEKQIITLKDKKDRARDTPEDAGRPDEANPSKKKLQGQLQSNKYKYTLKANVRQYEKLLTKLKDNNPDSEISKRIKDLFECCEELDLLHVSPKWQKMLETLEENVEKLATATASFPNMSRCGKLGEAQTEIKRCQRNIRKLINNNKYKAQLIALQANEDVKERIVALVNRCKDFNIEIKDDSQPGSSSSVEKSLTIERTMVSKYWDLLPEDVKRELIDMKKSYTKPAEDLKNAKAEIDIKYQKNDKSEERLKEYKSLEIQKLVEPLEKIESVANKKYGRLGIQLLRLHGFP